MIEISVAVLGLIIGGCSLVATPANFDFATGAVVSFILMLLGIAAALLLMLKFTGKSVGRNE